MYLSCIDEHCHIDTCEDCRKGDETRGGLHIQRRKLAQAFDIFEAPLDLPQVTFNFERTGAIPSGWKLARNVTAPIGFRFTGGDACVIESLSSHQRRVLVALPEWALDMSQCSWLIKFRDGSKPLVRLWSAERYYDNAILEFDFPKGESVAQRHTRSVCMAEREACKLCRELVEFLTGLRSTPFHLSGLLDDSLVFLTQFSLSCIVPLGCLLSIRGMKAAASSVLDRGGSASLAPEIRDAVIGNGIIARNSESRFATDSYAIAALVRKVLTWRQLDSMDVHKRRSLIMDPISDVGVDWMNKSLYEDPEWRLCGHSSLQHPWFSQR